MGSANKKTFSKRSLHGGPNELQHYEQLRNVNMQSVWTEGMHFPLPKDLNILLFRGKSM